MHESAHTYACTQRPGRDGDLIYKEYALARSEGRVDDAKRLRDELALRFAQLAWAEATKHAGPWVRDAIGGADDGFQAAMVGVLIAIDKFNPDFRQASGKPVKFITYATNVVYNQLRSQARKCRMIQPPDNLDASKPDIEGDESWNARLRAARAAMNIGGLPGGADDERLWEPESRPEPDRQDHADDLTSVKRAMRCLTEREAQVLDFLYGLDGCEEKRSSTQAAEHFGVSKQCVSQHELSAIKHVKRSLDRKQRGLQAYQRPIGRKRKPVQKCVRCGKENVVAKGTCMSCVKVLARSFQKAVPVL